ncbi:hypothetical protein C8Q74DRAFT_387419 [Fomes fomentarius]|nr:hypothetical protein C8Q74DRAFT_387419 [Fomes fomentarius]
MMSQSTLIRLLNTRTGEFHFAKDLQEIQYAILSHVWSEDGEQSYNDLLSIHHTVHVERAATPDLPQDAILQRTSSKIQQACARALSDGFEFIWIDFCCIDTSNETEVSDAVNSAYAWYGGSAMCYAYLEDVDPEDNICAPDSQFRRSRWHTRMWTLPELIASKHLTFLASDWRPLGTKHALARVVKEISGVDSGILSHDIPLSSVSVACRMSWAAKRLTSRKEDEGYALMGLFGVKMAVTYEEGALAFFRLQEEILKLDSDQSLFVWDTSPSASTEEQAGALPPAYDESRHMLFAPCPAAFARSAGVKVVALNAVPGRRHRGSRDDQAFPTYVSTPDGLRATLPTLSVGPFTHLALLSCTDEQGCRLGLVLRKVDADIYAVGSMAWEDTCARYRSSLRCLPWGANARSRGRSDDINSEDEDEFAPLLDNGGFTRVVRIVKQYPGSVPFHTICIAHRSLPPTPPPAYEASSWPQRMVPLLSFPEFEDDLVRVDPEDRSPAGVFRWCCSTVADICGFFCCIMLGMVLLFVFLGVLFLTSLKRVADASKSGGSDAPTLYG